MKNFTKALCLALVAIMCLATLASCGGTGFSKNTFNIGASGPLTGSASSYGISVDKGAQLAVKQLNAAGGINGVQVKYKMKDDGADAEKAKNNFNTLFEAGMHLSLGAVTSGACEGFAQRANEEGVFFLTPSASAASVIADRPTGFRVCFGDPDQGILAAQQIKKDGYSKIGVIYDESDEYSSGIYDAFKKEAANLGLTYTEKTFNSAAEQNKDFSAQVEALKDCDVIFCPFYYTEAALVAGECQTKGCKAVLFGCDGFDGIQIPDGVTNTVLYITPFDVKSTDEKVKSFVEAYKEEYGKEPDQFAADGYDAVMAIAEAMKALGITDVTISAKDLGAKISAKIAADDFSFTGVTGKMTWNAAGEPTKAPIIIDMTKK